MSWLGWRGLTLWVSDDSHIPRIILKQKQTNRTLYVHNTECCVHFAAWWLTGWDTWSRVYCQSSNLLRERSSVRIKQLTAWNPGKAGPESSALTVCLLPLSTGRSYIVTEIILKLWKNPWYFDSLVPGFLTSRFGLSNFFSPKPCINFSAGLHTKLMHCCYEFPLDNKSRLHELILLSLCFDWQLNDNSEALAHQRLATKMLAAKMKEMEKRGNAGDSQTV